MKVALYGGTFDPVHLGHLAVAQAAVERFGLQRVYFVPAYIPPHKGGQRLSGYHHRYAMLALALAGETKLLPSALEAPEILRAEGGDASYSFDTVRRLRARLTPKDKLFFLIGIDAFLEIRTWHRPVELLRDCEFIVASRPGFSLADTVRALPGPMQPKGDIVRVFEGGDAHGTLTVSGAVIHFLEGIYKPESSTRVRKAAMSGRGLARLVPPAVAEYIRKLHLYRGRSEPGSPEVEGDLLRKSKAGKRDAGAGKF